MEPFTFPLKWYINDELQSKREKKSESSRNREEVEGQASQ